MTGRSFSLLSLPVFAALLAVLTLGLILLGAYLGLGTYSFFLLAVPVVLAVGYLAWYRTLPYEGPVARPEAVGTEPSPEEEEEPFEDPVEEADRIESGAESPVGAAEADDAPESSVPP